MQEKIFLSPPHLTGKEYLYIKEALDSNWVAPLGPFVDRFENEIEQYVGARKAVALSSGTAALHLALKVLGVGPGDYVICPTFTFAATANAIIYCGANPVFIDCENKSWNMNPNILNDSLKLLNQRNKKPKAIVIVQLYGKSGNLDDLLEVANLHSIPTVEDAAESLGSKYKNKHTGTFANIGVFSFNGNKIITTSGGGAAVSNDESLIEKMRFLSTQARENVPWYEHNEVGFNYRMSNILAAIGCAQLAEIENRIEKRRQIFQAYSKAFDDNCTPIEMHREGDFERCNYWLSTGAISNGKSPSHIIEILQNKQIEARHLWKPLHLQLAYLHFDKFIDGSSERLFEKGLCLPSGSALRTEQIQTISRYLDQALK